MKISGFWMGCMTVLSMVVTSPLLQAGEAVSSSASAAEEPVFAKVNGRVIGLKEFEALYVSTMRQRFYHGNVPEGQGEVVFKEVTELMIERALLLEEADRRGLKPNADKIEQAVAGYEKQYANSPMWKSQREKLLPGLRAQLTRQDLLEQIDGQLREVQAPSPDEVRAYYDQRRELFVEPEKLHLAVILLKVDPSSPDEVWKQAWEKAEGIAKKINEGAVFADEARAHSGDISASDGGDLGYVHRGMLPEAIQSHIDQAKVGNVEGPIKVLEGVALYRLEKKLPPKQMEFSAVEGRARELLLRDKKDQARKEALARLREGAKVEILATMVAPPK